MLCLSQEFADACDNDVREQEEEDHGASEPVQLPEAEEACGEQEIQGELPLRWGADALLKNFSRKIGKQKDLDDGSIGAKAAMERVAAAAEAAMRGQEESLGKALRVVQRLHSAHDWEPVAFVEHQLFDETGLDARVAYTEGADRQGFDRQTAHLFVVETSWFMLVRRRSSSVDGQGCADNFAVLEGRLSPQLRATANTTGEAVRDVLASCPCPPGSVTKTFPVCCRICETDQNGANYRGEALIMQRRDPSWWRMGVACQCHQVHSCAARTWELQEPCISALVHLSKILQGSGALSALKATLKAIVKEELHVAMPHEVAETEQASEFKAMIAEYFGPPAQHPRRSGIMEAAKSFYNGNWRNAQPVHICHGCCQSEEHARCKGAFIIARLASSLRPTIFNKSNWQHWTQALSFYGVLLALHGLLARAFLQTFAGQSLTVAQAAAPLAEPESPWPAEEVEAGIARPAAAARASEGANAALRAENARSMMVSTEFLRSPTPLHDILLLRLPLDAERALMYSLLHETSKEWERQQLCHFQRFGTRQFRVLNAHDGVHFTAFFRATWETFVCRKRWQIFDETEEFRSKLLVLCMRASSLCYQLLWVRTRGFPWRLLALLRPLPPPELEQIASEVLRCPPCLHDYWTTSVLKRFGTIAALVSTECRHFLFLVARKVMCTTYTTERLHSRNLKTSRGRLTHRASVSHLALSHMGESLPSDVVVSKELRDRAGPEPQKQDQKVAGVRKKVKRGGGAYRAFLSQHASGKQLSKDLIKELTGQYRSLTEEAKSRYKEIGRRGSVTLCMRVIGGDPEWSGPR